MSQIEKDQIRIVISWLETTTTRPKSNEPKKFTSNFEFISFTQVKCNFITCWTSCDRCCGCNCRHVSPQTDPRWTRRLKFSLSKNNLLNGFFCVPKAYNNITSAKVLFVFGGIQTVVTLFPSHRNFLLNFPFYITINSGFKCI